MFNTRSAARLSPDRGKSRLRRQFLSRAVALVLIASAAGLQGAAAQTIDRGPEAIGRRPINPGISLPQPGQSVSGLDAQKLDTYRTQIQNQMERDRLSGRDMTPGGARQMQNLDGALGRVNGALNQH
jgi:hypothetical protein